jgi:RNA polymerase sigma-70 factor (ECF subfamily)
MDERTRQVTILWTKHQPIVSAFVSSIVRDFRDRDDVLQEIALAVVESFDSYDSSRPFIAWAFGIARNQIGLYLRQRQRNRLVFDDQTVAHLAQAFVDLNPDPSPTRYDHLQDCLGTLEARARKICQLRYEQDMKPAEIGNHLGMTPNTVAKALQRIRESLAACIRRKSVEAGMR